LLQPSETRAALDKIMDRVEAWHRAGAAREALTADQPADGPYLLMRLQKADADRAGKVRELLRWVGGAANGSGIGIANIDTQGNVHPDRFWQTHTLGNVREDSFNAIWRNTEDPILRGLRKTPRPVKGRCARCRHLAICGGGFRVRAWQKFGDPWAEDPGCYLSDAEIAA
jgi:radical SAM protein with 4Fe4S-binding SPASM domain